MNRFFAALAAALVFSLGNSGLWGQGPGGPSALEAQAKHAMEGALASMVKGPKAVSLGDLAQFQLAKEDGFLDGGSAQRFLLALGNKPGKAKILGMVCKGRQFDTFLIFEAYEDGHVDDSEANQLNASSLLTTIQSNTEATNKERVAMGGAPLQITGWDEAPHYEKAGHTLIWALKARELQDEIINYTQIVFGREARISMTAVSDLAEANETKDFARKVLAATQFNAGKRYEDYNPSTDRLAEYGLAAIVTGFAAKKLGLIALIAAFFVKGWKLILIAVAVVGGGLFKVFAGKKETSAPENPS